MKLFHFTATSPGLPAKHGKTRDTWGREHIGVAHRIQGQEDLGSHPCSDTGLSARVSLAHCCHLYREG